MQFKKVYIIILNWNGYKDTIECLESVFCNVYENYQVIVCDNNSSDDSLNKIKSWAEGKVSWSEYGLHNKEERKKEEATLILIQTGENLGFAGGNNIGIKYALDRDDFEYVWLLNNDTVIDEYSLVNLVKMSNSNKTIGICGSKLMEYYNRDKIQSLGGKYNCFFSTPRNIYDESKIGDLDYVIGASMLVSKCFLKEVGLMSEEYFLYYEEVDWVMRGRKKFSFCCALDSVVYHKEGASIGSKCNAVERSETADYYALKNRIVFTKKYFPLYLPTVYLGLFVAMFNRIRRKQYNRVKLILRIIKESL